MSNPFSTLPINQDVSFFITTSIAATTVILFQIIPHWFKVTMFADKVINNLSLDIAKMFKNKTINITLIQKQCEC